MLSTQLHCSVCKNTHPLEDEQKIELHCIQIHKYNILYNCNKH